MSKLGYTWYPKDWGNSDAVFELNLSERGLYRELIDLAMLSDNNVQLSKQTWVRKFCVKSEELEQILAKLSALNLIIIAENVLFIPSCEARLNYCRSGSKGGKSKQTAKRLVKRLPKRLGKQTTKQTIKQTANQIEKKVNIKESNNNTRVEKTRDADVDFNKFIEFFNSFANRSFKPTAKVKTALTARLKQYPKKEIMQAIKNAHQDDFHVKNNFKYLTPEFILREDKLEMFINTVPESNQVRYSPEKTN